MERENIKLQILVTNCKLLIRTRWIPLLQQPSTFSLFQVNTQYDMFEDIVYDNYTRNGAPCWHRYTDVGIMAVNEAMLICETCFFVLNKKYSNTNWYVPLMDAFHEYILTLTIGYTVNNMTCRNAKNNVDEYTLDRYDTGVEYKTSPIFSFPIDLALMLSNINLSKETTTKAKELVNAIGHYHQVKVSLWFRKGNGVNERSSVFFQDKMCYFIYRIRYYKG